MEGKYSANWGRHEDPHRPGPVRRPRALLLVGAGRRGGGRHRQRQGDRGRERPGGRGEERPPRGRELSRAGRHHRRWRLMGHHPPVENWATDFDHTDDVWAADPFPIWDELRNTCPIAHSPRYGGVWLPTRHDDVAAVAYDTENFTSRSILVSKFRPP